jgi:hypothetical protein
LGADKNIDPALAAPPPHWCLYHGWGPCSYRTHAVVAPVEAVLPPEDDIVVVDDEEEEVAAAVCYPQGR